MFLSEEVRRLGLLGIKSIQTTFPNGDNFFFFISRLADPLYCFTILIPIAAGLNTALATDMLMVSVMAEWSNTLLKWLLMDHRPFWWVQETNLYSKNTRPILRQTPLTCETGPGSPSGHVQGIAAVLYVVLKYIIETYIVPSEKLSDFKKLYLRIIFWSLYLGLIVLVGMSRLYTATHFPHQTLLGFFAGVLTAWLFVENGRFTVTQYWHAASRLKMMMYGLIMIGVSFGAYWLQRLLGVDPQWSVRLAFKWCEHPEWIHVSTTPLFSLVRCCGSMFGLALSAPIASSLYMLKCEPDYLKIMVSVFVTYLFGYMYMDLEMTIPRRPLFLYHSLQLFLSFIYPFLFLAILPHYLFLKLLVVSGLKCAPDQATKITSVFVASSLAIMIEDLKSYSKKGLESIISLAVYFFLSALVRNRPRHNSIVGVLCTSSLLVAFQMAADSVPTSDVRLFYGCQFMLHAVIQFLLFIGVPSAARLAKFKTQ